MERTKVFIFLTYVYEPNDADPIFHPHDQRWTQQRFAVVWRRHIDDPVQLQVGRENGHNGRTDLKRGRQRDRKQKTEGKDKKYKHK